MDPRRPRTSDALHMVPALARQCHTQCPMGTVPHTTPAPAGPGPGLHVMLAGTTCSTGPRLVAAGTTCSAVPELPGQAVCATCTLEWASYVMQSGQGGRHNQLSTCSSWSGICTTASAWTVPNVGPILASPGSVPYALAHTVQSSCSWDGCYVQHMSSNPPVELVQCVLCPM